MFRGRVIATIGKPIDSYTDHNAKTKFHICPIKTIDGLQCSLIVNESNLKNISEDKYYGVTVEVKSYNNKMFLKTKRMKEKNPYPIIPEEDGFFFEGYVLKEVKETELEKVFLSVSNKFIIKECEKRPINKPTFINIKIKKEDLKNYNIQINSKISIRGKIRNYEESFYLDPINISNDDEFYSNTN